MKPVYFDYNATTPTDPRVLEAMLPFFKDIFGNPSSVSHPYGWEADRACRKAREWAAQLLSVKPQEIYFTSGATESNNIALQGVARHFIKNKQPIHIVTSAVEHKAILDVVYSLPSWGVEIDVLQPDIYGRVSLQDLEKRVKPHTRLVSFIHGNNEIGTLNPIDQIGQFCKDKKILFHTDAAQTLGKFNFIKNKIHFDLLSGSGQKMYGPKGIGILFVREEIRHFVEPLFYGGSQERGLRPGTHNVPGIIGLGEACRLYLEEHDQEKDRLTAWRDQIIHKILHSSHNVQLNGHPEERLYTNLNFTFKNCDPDYFTLVTQKIAASTASACSAGAPSHVLKAIGISTQDSHTTLRIGLGRMTTSEDITILFEVLNNLIKSYT